jgi:hypothetical protein
MKHGPSIRKPVSSVLSNTDFYGTLDGGFIMIPKEEAAAADINPARHTYIEKRDIWMICYPVLSEAVYEMHCVNLLRINI